MIAGQGAKGFMPVAVKPLILVGGYLYMWQLSEWTITKQPAQRSTVYVCRRRSVSNANSQSVYPKKVPTTTRGSRKQLLTRPSASAVI